MIRFGDDVKRNVLVRMKAAPSSGLQCAHVPNTVHPLSSKFTKSTLEIVKRLVFGSHTPWVVHRVWSTCPSLYAPISRSSECPTMSESCTVAPPQGDSLALASTYSTPAMSLSREIKSTNLDFKEIKSFYKKDSQIKLDNRALQIILFWSFL